MTAVAARVRTGPLIGYALGSIGTGLYLTVPSVLLLYFLTDVVGASAAAAGLVLLVPKLAGVVTDPVVGALSDRTVSRWGRRRPWLLAGAVGLSVTFLFLFRVPAWPVGARVAYVLGVYVLTALSYALFAVPYVAMSAEVSPDPGERTRVVAVRMAFVMVGVVIGSAGAPALVAAFHGGRAGYGAMSLVIGGVCAAAMLGAVLGTAALPSHGTPVPTRLSVRALGQTLGDASFRLLAVLFMLQTAAFGLFAALLPHAVVHLLGGEEQRVGLLLLTLLGSTVIALPAWTIATRRWSKLALLRAASLAQGAATLTLLGIGPHYPALLLHAQFALFGGLYAGLQLIPFALMTDAASGPRESARHPNAGELTGIWTACEKLGLAIGPGLAALTLSLGGYASSTSRPAEQSAASLLAIRLGLTLGPTILQGLSMLIVRRLAAGPKSARTCDPARARDAL